MSESQGRLSELYVHLGMLQWLQALLEASLELRKLSYLCVHIHQTPKCKKGLLVLLDRTANVKNE